MSMYKNLTTICAVAALSLGLAACGGGGSDSPTTDNGGQMQGPTPAEQIAALQAQINTLRAELGLDPIDIDDLTSDVADLRQQVTTLQGQIDDAADKAADDAYMAMKATAAKLYAGIAAQSGDVANTTAAGTALAAATERGAAYNNVDVPAAGTAVDTRIMVGIGTATPVALTEDKKTEVADNYGWTGKRYADPAGGDSVEAIVYSNDKPTKGRKFGSAEPGTGDSREYEYTLVNGMYTVDGTTAGNAPRVGGSGFDHTAGVKTFKLPSPNPSGVTKVAVSGSFHGVSGTYTCTPGDGNTCAAQVAARGFTLGLVPDGSPFAANATAWTFRPGNASAQVTDTLDSAYASYGWWLHKTENGKTFTASAFVDEKGVVDGATGLTALQGTATYRGGAAGKYALSSATGGTNDAGHFTAEATLEADFSDNSITGIIDHFHGADGMERDWSVELKEAALSDTGGITRTGANQANNDTVWTIGGTAAAASGEWSGDLRDNGTDGVPKVATGTFYTEYGTAGRMVGGFGANKE